MRRTFSRAKWGTDYSVVVEVSETTAGPKVSASMSGRNGQSGFSRRTDLGVVTSDVRDLFLAAPGYVLADALQECGLDEGMVNVIREAA